ncbi:MAG: copper uptake system-associated protein [Sphingomonadales bacterium]|nr:MAG: copper uptake system-associated protein [Sphingomonadales bacterium]
MHRVGWLAGALLLAGCIPNTVLDESKVRQATETHFGSRLAPIDIGPIVVSGNHAVADWTQGQFGGRALYERHGGGWMLLLCSGDSVRRADNLRRAGVPDFNAGWIADQLAAEEAALPPERLACMKRFVGTAADHEKYLKTLGDK